MDLEQLKQILSLVREHALSEFEIEQDGLRLKIRKDAAGAEAAVPVGSPAAPLAAGLAPGAAHASPAAPGGAAAGDVDTEIELAVVKSPLVGIFYRSPDPNSAPFVEIGATVEKGQVLCIIEAMKLMNEIDSEYDGEIVNVYVESGQPVQYGERLFAIRAK